MEVDNTDDRQLTEGWDPTYTGNQTYMGPLPAQPPTNDVPCTDWVRQQVLNNRAKGAGYESPPEPVIVPLGVGWTISKLAPPPPTQMLATTEYVDQQVAEAMDSIRDSMAMSSKWVNRRIAEEIAKEKAAFHRFLLRQAVCFVVGLVIGWLVVGWLWI